VGDGRLFDSDPVAEVFEHYKVTVPGKADSRLTQPTRKLIKRALDERPIDRLKLAINGLAVSQHHIDGGWLGIQYAIGKVKQSETPGDRIDMMAAKAPAQSNSSDGGVTVDELLRTVPSDRHWIIRDTMSLVIAAIKRGERAEREEEMLRRSPGVEPIIVTARVDQPPEFKGWRRVS
jgi:hypothetical protein